MKRRVRRFGTWRLRFGAVVIVGLAASTALMSGPSSSKLSHISSAIGRTSAGHESLSAGFSSAARLADKASAETGGSCPPNATYPDSSTDETQYGVPFTADIIGGTVNVGYDEDTGGPGTLPLTNQPWFPWLLHLTGLSGTVSGCVPLPGLSLQVQPDDLHINTFGAMTGPDGCTTSQNGCSLAAHASATYTFSGIANPEQTDLPVFLAGNTAGGEDNASGVSTLRYRITPTTDQGLRVTDPTFTEEYQYPNSGAAQKVNLPAGSAPGAALDTNIYGGTVSVTNTTASTITSVSGEESAGFISGPTSLAAGQTATYTFTFEGSGFGYLPDQQTMELSFTGEGSTGLVDGSTIAYYTFPSQNVASLEISAATINGSNALTGSGPTLASGATFNGTVTLTNDTSSAVTDIFGETSEAVQLMATVSPSGFQSPPIVLGGFSLNVSASSPLTADVVGSRPDSYGTSPYGALDSIGSASVSGAFSATSLPLACGANVSTKVTTGTSTQVPASPSGEPAHTAGSQWTMQGEPISGELEGATGRLVSNTLSLKIPYNAPAGYTQTCGVYGELFNWEIGGVEPNGDYYNCPTCTTYGRGGAVDAGAGPGEVQVQIDILVTSIGGLPVCRPSTTASTACSS